MDQQQKLNAFIYQAISSGMNREQIRGQLLQAGWPPAAIDQALTLAYNGQIAPSPQPPKKEPKVKQAILWFLSPIITFVMVAIFQLMQHSVHSNLVLINVLSILGGFIGILLIPVGIIMAVIKMSGN